MAGEERGVVFPAGPDGRRSTAALGRAVVADALRPVDPTGAAAAERETNWRAGYLTHFRRLVEAGLSSRAAALSVADAGLAAVHARMRVAGADGEAGLDVLGSGPAGRALGTAEVRGTAEPERELTLPFHGRRLQGDALLRQLDAWVAAGVVEPSCAEAVRTVAAHPEWLALPDTTVVVLGAGAEMGPLTALLRWGARVAGVDLPRAPLWERVLDTARRGAGTLLLPVGDPAAGVGAGDVTAAAGADLIAEVPAVAEWVTGLPGRLVLGNYVYADGATNVRVSVAVDALTARLAAAREDLALAFLATPTDVFAVPAEAVEQSVRAYAARSRVGKLVGRPLRTLSAGRLLQRAYVPGSDPGVADSLVAQQGPNYALAKRLQRWRATTARAAGTTVSMNVAPPTRTRSVVKNRALAAAYAGAHRFGVEVFEPATSNVLMAALLVHDLHTGGGPACEHPWQDEAHAAAHGGLWRSAYAPRSALGLAALLGYGAARS
ncbi:hypothetical protein [Geodermatophilus sabuli]|uniref:Uncharacterized protein n=1 Tax=Geodermatophilus sabuli TaxID=1564158 RepID=A0A285EFU7_9ACTN|nr:hypothetical protein [Geodermatophilus sabuli]MBB3083002.1 hypothetical protein [Geodermatophilus sabuli]SNX97999.1 hypothetical protein SAMN06893097_10979 [Geodermatophilus sabuli]